MVGGRKGGITIREKIGLNNPLKKVLLDNSGEDVLSIYKGGRSNLNLGGFLN